MRIAPVALMLPRDMVQATAISCSAMTLALAAPRDGRPETVESLGQGWVAEEALAIALYACFAGRGFEDALRIAVTHGGDSDSTGAIAGNMLGAMDPEAVLAHRWIAQVEVADVVERLVDEWVGLQG